jgi:hypothetical protein
VEDQLRVADRLADRVQVGQVALDQLDVAAHPGQVGGAAGAEVVQHADRVAAGHERFHQVRADEAGAAGYQTYCHEFIPYP